MVRLGRLERPLNALSTHSLCRLGYRRANWRTRQPRLGCPVQSGTVRVIPQFQWLPPHRLLDLSVPVRHDPRTGCGTACGSRVRRRVRWERRSCRRPRSPRLKEPGRYGDGHGLWLHVGPTGTKSWVLRYHARPVWRARWASGRSTRWPSPMRVNWRGSARADASSTASTRWRCGRLGAADASWSGARGMTFAECRRAVSSPRTRAAGATQCTAPQWRATLETYADPVIGCVAGRRDRHGAGAQGA